MSILRLLIALGASAMLFGCASTPDETRNPLSWLQRSAKLSQLSDWQVKGKIAIRTAQQSESGSLIWQQAKHNTHISLSGPMGLGATIIESDGKELLVRSDGTTHRYDISSNQIAMASTGWDLPLASLTHWIKGLPYPHSDIQAQTIDRGLCRVLEQDGWTVTFERYARFEHYTLPTRLKIERDDTRARLILTHWTGLRSR